ncbi:MAG: hypothetical protein QW828_02095 [Candidatus Bathyarchaeia archaeon]
MDRVCRLLLPATLVAIMLLIVASLMPPSASATKGSYPGANGRIAFSENDVIFIMNEDGANI